MTYRRFEHEMERRVEVAGLGTVTVRVSSPQPIREEDYLILRPAAAAEMGRCLATFGRAVAPPEESGL
jgi:hypothetical protein